MNEWSAIQKKAKESLRQALFELEEKANPFRKNLTKEEQTSKAKLSVIATRSKRGENVQNGQQQTWLSEDEYA